MLVKAFPYDNRSNLILFLNVILAQNGRLYATKHLRVLLRANVAFFSNWGMELLVTQLHDRNKAISVEALDILDEACEDKVKPVNTYGQKGGCYWHREV